MATVGAPRPAVVTGSRMNGQQPRTKTAPLKSSTASTPSSLSSSSIVAALQNGEQAVNSALAGTAVAVNGSTDPTKILGGGVVSCLDFGLDEDALLARKLAEQLATAPPERVKRGRKSKTEALSALSAQADKRAPGVGGKIGGIDGLDSRDGGRSTPSKKKKGDDLADQPPGPAKNPMRRGQKVEKGPPLDFDTVRTVAPREEPPPRHKPRIFGLQHCPIFYPTVDEFAQPMAYMAKVGKEARDYGIAKIVPPEGWKPPFVLDTETFRFKTRLQRLNSMEASARASVNFLEQLYVFHKQQGVARIKVPVVNGRPVDLWRLRKEVNLHGGFDVVTAKRKWATLAKSIGYDVKSSPAISFQLKTAYQKIIAPFDEYILRVKGTNATPNGTAGGVPTVPDESAVPVPSTSAQASAISDSLSPPPSDGPKTPEPPSDDKARVAILSHTPGLAAANGTSADESPVTIERVTQAALKLNSVLAANAGEDEPRVKAPAIDIANPAFDGMATGWEDPPDRGGEICEICGSDEDDPNILLCDCCDKGYHLQCLNPPLEDVPDGNWYCDACIISTGNEFGFEEGKEHSLHSFQRRADGFKRAWLERYPVSATAVQKIFGGPDIKGKGKEAVPEDQQAAKPVWTQPEFQAELALEDHIEREFWRLVESQTETVEIEYGADVHSSTFGSGLPDLESHPLEPYARDGWNLNNLPIAPGSLLRYIKSDIAGMTRPWLYVGMVFSTFAWHKEDHYTYSVNYHQWGDTKTWYGVPGADDVKLEAAMKNAAPELFEQQPDLMYQLVTLLSPGRLKRAGVRTYVCDQRPNEFVVTCPRSYHAGFNHGLNFNEAVNFCLPDWLADGLLCAQHYHNLSKVPVFSHDELLVTLSMHEKNPKSSRWLLPHFKEMVERELAARAEFREITANLTEEIVDADLPEDQFQCYACKTFAYLSHVISPGCPRIACHEHTHVLGQGQKVLRCRYTDDALSHMLHRVKARSDKAGRVGDLSLTGEPMEQRTSGRKRKPSAALLEAAGADISRPTQRAKLDHRPTPDASTLQPIAEDEMELDEDVKPGVEEAPAEPAVSSDVESDGYPEFMRHGADDEPDRSGQEGRYWSEIDEDAGSPIPEPENELHGFDAAQAPHHSMAPSTSAEGTDLQHTDSAFDGVVADDEIEVDELEDDDEEEDAPLTSRTIAMAAPDPVPALSVSPARKTQPPQPVQRTAWAPAAPSAPSDNSAGSVAAPVVGPMPPPGRKPRKPRALKPPSFTKNGKRRGRPPKSEAAKAAEWAARAEAAAAAAREPGAFTVPHRPSALAEASATSSGRPLAYPPTGSSRVPPLPPSYPYNAGPRPFVGLPMPQPVREEDDAPVLSTSSKFYIPPIPAFKGGDRAKVSHGNLYGGKTSTPSPGGQPTSLPSVLLARTPVAEPTSESSARPTPGLDVRPSGPTSLPRSESPPQLAQPHTDGWRKLGTPPRMDWPTGRPTPIPDPDPRGSAQIPPAAQAISEEMSVTRAYAVINRDRERQGLAPLPIPSAGQGVGSEPPAKQPQPSGVPLRSESSDLRSSTQQSPAPEPARSTGERFRVPEIPPFLARYRVPPVPPFKGPSASPPRADYRPRQPQT